MRRPVTRPRQIVALDVVPGRAPLADHRERDIERLTLLEPAADLARDAEAPERQGGLHLVGRLEPHHVFFHLHRQVSVIARQLAALEQPQPLVVPGHDGHPVVDRLLEIGALLGFPVDHEGRGSPLHRLDRRPPHRVRCRRLIASYRLVRPRAAGETRQ
jgi:hypothetical protein